MTVINKDVEIPYPLYRIKWGFHEYEVGDSAAIPYKDNELEVTRFRVAASAFGKRNDKVFTSRITKEKGKKMLRIWRIE